MVAPCRRATRARTSATFSRARTKATPAQDQDRRGAARPAASAARSAWHGHVFSELFDATEDVLTGIARGSRRGHDVCVFHVSIATRSSSRSRRMTLFHGLRADARSCWFDPRSLRDAYLDEIEGFRPTIRKGCLSAAHRLRARLVNHHAARRRPLLYLRVPRSAHKRRK
jgi:hypothetical protein